MNAEWTSGIKKTLTFGGLCGVGALLSLGHLTSLFAEEGLSFESTFTATEKAEQQSLAPFCDHAFIALNKTDPSGSMGVIDVYEELKDSGAGNLPAEVLAELLQAQIISKESPEKILQAYQKLSASLKTSGLSPSDVAELTKISIAAQIQPSLALAQLRSTWSLRPKWSNVKNAFSLGKAFIISKQSSEATTRVIRFFEKRMANLGEADLISLTSAVLLTGKSPSEILKLFDTVSAKLPATQFSYAYLTQFAALTNLSAEALKIRVQQSILLKRTLPQFSSAHLLASATFSNRSVRQIEAASRTWDGMLASPQRSIASETTEGAEKSDEAPVINAEDAQIIKFGLSTFEIVDEVTNGISPDMCDGASARLVFAVMSESP